MMTGQYLFSNRLLREVLESRREQMKEEIKREDQNYLLNVNFADYCNHLAQKYSIEPIRLNEDGIIVDQQEIHSNYSMGTRVTYYIPFSGANDLFLSCPSTRTYNPPRGITKNQILELSFDDFQGSSSQIKNKFDKTIAEIKRWIDWITNEVNQHNQQLLALAQESTKNRREKLLRDQNLVAELGFPIKKRENTPLTYTVPEIKRKIVPKPEASTEPFQAEPDLTIEEYEHILSIISNMAFVMERSPKAFQSMSEPDIRQHFLVQLNGHYEGQATGETFNYEGKTDILIRSQGRNIFIAECKFWEGAKGLLETVSQILDYLSWRDTKTAILLFNKNKDFSNVISQIPIILTEHPNYKNQLPFKCETGFRFVLTQKNDRNRELTLTILAFDIPAS
jgi:hypothetical protein